MASLAFPSRSEGPRQPTGAAAQADCRARLPERAQLGCCKVSCRGQGARPALPAASRWHRPFQLAHLWMREAGSPPGCSLQIRQDTRPPAAAARGHRGARYGSLPTRCLETGAEGPAAQGGGQFATGGRAARGAAAEARRGAHFCARGGARREGRPRPLAVGLAVAARAAGRAPKRRAWRRGGHSRCTQVHSPEPNGGARARARRSSARNRRLPPAPRARAAPAHRRGARAPARGRGLGRAGGGGGGAGANGGGEAGAVCSRTVHSFRVAAAPRHWPPRGGPEEPEGGAGHRWVGWDSVQEPRRPAPLAFTSGAASERLQTFWVLRDAGCVPGVELGAARPLGCRRAPWAQGAALKKRRGPAGARPAAGRVPKTPEGGLGGRGRRMRAQRLAITKQTRSRPQIWIGAADLDQGPRSRSQITPADPQAAAS